MTDFFPLYIYAATVLFVTLTIVGLSTIFAPKTDNPVKFLPYESGIQTETQLLQERFPLRHYLVALIFLIFDIEVIFLYPWAVIAKTIGPFAFYEMAFFLVALLAAFAYLWKKGGLQWD
ncbi:MAG: NADH-quinone oxidoreductase subunit A [Parachlamydiaceae bacterium]